MRGTRTLTENVRDPLLLAGVVAAATVVVAVDDPGARHWVTCPFLSLTGWSCPLCGSLRATHDLAHLDLAAAWASNPLWVVAVPVLALAWLGWFRSRLRAGRTAPRGVRPPGSGPAGAGATGARPRGAGAVPMVGPRADDATRRRSTGRSHLASVAVVGIVLAFWVLRNVPALTPWLGP
ncbi:uncharacterized protein DUF2752 [Sediminihabitans luteus]|uniref:Uncharacterized protein DUF2752 n=1 Tax=Sediminihabitans luteus TaxID=1138585 RepID=A0A2M9CR83_9CELL|nr:DUF2752 domain-containing protein [Sediminihabitans luteus]PJJ74345.1 uncharacterized protein DUF2752 [Sediminihabitans luteus]GIJ00457.1 hypothetical protein Slu03_28340 [Sediminihabitans luteus]